ncbi:hypothetical protein [Pseudonocardia sp. WMMC193]|uniref:hypothetical protein n=1 Tax=Pseudonocardia sp. WMMC193 TaxID=2911965 RepID=UPI001F32512F|nr:hypothetical protein [Pseudonocardia sp. WMMC193]MCF7548915.1 hypothetical protein [Pseudonocardia sp. WMMC193]
MTHDPALDTAVLAHQALDRAPENHRTALAALIAMPVDYPICSIGGACGDPICDGEDCDHDREIVGRLTVGQLTRDLREGVATPELVIHVLGSNRMLLPGLAGAQ